MGGPPPAAARRRSWDGHELFVRSTAKHSGGGGTVNVKQRVMGNHVWIVEKRVKQNVPQSIWMRSKASKRERKMCGTSTRTAQDRSRMLGSKATKSGPRRQKNEARGAPETVKDGKGTKGTNRPPEMPITFRNDGKGK